VSLFDRAVPAGAPGRTWVGELRENQPVGEVFLVLAKNLRYTRSGSAFLALELGDKTGRIQARVWENAEALHGRVTVDRFVRVEGQVVLFNDTLQINVSSLEVVPDESVELSDFFPCTTRDLAEMEAELRSVIAQVRRPELQALLRSFFDDPEFWSLFRSAPAAKQIHHAALGGLLEHTLAVARLCQDLCRRYPRLDADLLVTAALLHDAGKTRELTWSRRFDYSDEGRLIGHIVIGAEMVTQRAAAIEGFPPETLLRLRHMLLSHHGQYEWGSPKRPKTLEAVALHHADDLDGKLNAVESFLRGEEERDPESRWTSYHRTLDRYLYRGPGETGG